jgi:hypothetical protein
MIGAAVDNNHMLLLNILYKNYHRNFRMLIIIIKMTIIIKTIYYIEFNILIGYSMIVRLLVYLIN